MAFFWSMVRFLEQVKLHVFYLILTTLPFSFCDSRPAIDRLYNNICYLDNEILLSYCIPFESKYKVYAKWLSSLLLRLYDNNPQKTTDFISDK